MTDFEQMTDGFKYPGGFLWGKLIQVHRIGDYAIVEYHPRKSSRFDKDPQYEDTLEFHPFVNDEDVSETHLSLDGALVAAITYKATRGTMAVPWIFKMLDLEAA